MNIYINPKRVITILVIITVFLIAADLTGLISKHVLGANRIALFQLDREANIPTLYSSVTLLICSALLALIASIRKLDKPGEHFYWAGLAIIFFFLGIDESAGIHERLIIPLRSALGTSGVLFFAWIIPYGIFVMILGTLYLRFLMRLPTQTRFWVFLAGGLYLAGALGGEMLSGSWASAHGEENITYALLTSFEEMLELFGLLTFIHFLFLFMGAEFKSLSVKFNL
jgi:hypothetical protein